MQMNLNQKCASGASAVGAIDSRARLLEIVNRADNLAIDVSNAVLSADIARRHADDSHFLKMMARETTFTSPTRAKNPQLHHERCR